VIVLLLFFPDSDSEKSLKIGQYLTKLSYKKGVILGPPCTYSEFRSWRYFYFFGVNRHVVAGIWLLLPIWWKWHACMLVILSHPVRLGQAICGRSIVIKVLAVL